MIIHLPTFSQTDADLKRQTILSMLEGAGLSNQCITDQQNRTNAQGIVDATNLTINLEAKLTQTQVEDLVSPTYPAATYSAAAAPQPEQPEQPESGE